MTRRVDHLVLAVRNLDDAAAFYTRLGFHVGARNHHPWGTDNHVIQFASSFLELITVADAAIIPPHTHDSFSFGAFVRDHLYTREGLAMLALDSEDAPTDARRYHLAHGGRLHLEPAAGEGGFTGFSVGVPDIDAIRRRLATENIPFQDAPGGVAIAPDRGFGVRIGFEAIT